MDLWKKNNQILLSLSKEQNITFVDFDNPDLFENKITFVLEKLNLTFNKDALKFYNQKNRTSDTVDKIEDNQICKIYESFKNLELKN